jgi:hypothetical protein
MNKFSKHMGCGWAKNSSAINHILVNYAQVKDMTGSFIMVGW